MRRYVPLLIAGCALIAAACRDSAAPTASAKDQYARLGGGPNSFSKLVTPGGDDSAVTVVFQITPEGGSVDVGDFRLDFDSNAVCNPETSGYGPLFWQLSCQSLDTAITITARFWKESDGRYAEFLPDIRFNPAANVVISASRPDLHGSMSGEVMFSDAILYWKQIGDVRYFLDESWFDQSITTQYDDATNRVWRRIKHFSNVFVTSGGCEENPQQEGCEGGGGEGGPGGGQF